MWKKRTKSDLEEETRLIEEYFEIKRKLKKLERPDMEDTSTVSRKVQESMIMEEEDSSDLATAEENLGLNTLHNNREISCRAGTSALTSTDMGYRLRTGGHSDPIYIIDHENILENQENEEPLILESPIPLSEPEVSDFDCLYEDILKLLGEDPLKSKRIEAKFHPSLQKRWNFWLESGLPKQEKFELLKKYERLVLFQVSKLNREISSILGEARVKRDNYFKDQQNSLGSVLVSLGTAITSLLKFDEQLDKLLLLERLSDAGKLLTNLQFELTKARKSFITPGLNKNIKARFLENKSGNWLFEPNLSDNVKKVKSIEKLARHMKSQSSFKKPLQDSGQSLNFRSPSVGKYRSNQTVEEISGEESQGGSIVSEGTIQENIDVSTRAGRLKYFYEVWKSITKDKFVLSCISGYEIIFNCQISGNEDFVEPLRSNQEIMDYRLAIRSLLDKGAIARCKAQKGQFLSSYFLIPKASGGMRFILNLKKLNMYISATHFKMEDIRTAIRLVRKNFFMASLDLEDAYFLVPILKKSRKFLRFKFENTIYEFTSMPFGLCTAPLVFTKFMRPVVCHLRGQGLLSVIYLDDILRIGRDEITCRKNVESTKNLLESLGFIINYEKSVLVPSKKGKYLGFILDSVFMTLELPVKKKEIIKNSAKELVKGNKSASQAIKYAWMHIRNLENLKYKELMKNEEDYDTLMIISPQAKEELRWWEICDGERIHGFWSGEDLLNHIKFLELLAIYKALWAEENEAWLFASYIPSKENSSADELSRISNKDIE
ncbi:uncharacterized protein [Prorops nasuta]|uniref:uncharacterized protein n=1 Tax=Prorops nasuta TaxID=863751 RepID=UPI0034CD983A